jgi:phosphate transport system substrate-binding protein
MKEEYKMRKLFLRKKLLTSAVLVAVIVCALVPSLVFGASPSSSAVPGGAWQAGDQLRIDGSTTVFPIVAAALGVGSPGGVGTNGPFQQSGHPGLQAEVWQGGTGVGETDCQNQANDLGDASSLSGVGTTYPNLVATKIARDGICVIVNTDVGNVTNITVSEIVAIYNAYMCTSVSSSNVPSGVTQNTGLKWHTSSGGNGTGAIQNWDQVGGPNEPIVPISREIGSGTLSAMQSLSGWTANYEIATIYTDGTTREDSSADLVSAVEAEPYSIGFVGIGYASQIPSGSATILTVDGIKATPQNVTTDIASKLYPLSRYIYILQNDDPTDPTVVANRNYANLFLQFMTSPAGQDVVEQQSFVKLVPDADIEENGTINVLDLAALGLKWNFATTAYQNAHPGNYAGTFQAGDRTDINGDGVVNLLDLAQLGLWWNVTYGSSSDLTPAYPVLSNQ